MPSTYYQLFVWMAVTCAVTAAVILMVERARLPRIRTEARVVRKKYVEPTFDAFGTAMQPGGDQGPDSECEFPEVHLVTVEAGGKDVTLEVEPSMYNAVQVNGVVTLLCRVGRLSGRIYPDGIELPMPAMPQDKSRLC